MTRDWQLRSIPTELADRYVAEGWWTDETVGTTVATGLQRLARQTFSIWSAVHPWHGTFGEIDRAARSFATALHKNGVGPGDVVAFQLPNWVEGAIAFWGAAYAGAVVVPIVHFYGPKEVGYILGSVQPDVIVTADRFGKVDYLGNYESLLKEHGGRPWFVAGDGAAASLPVSATPLGAALDADPVSEPVPVDPNSPAVIGFTSGTTRDPKGVVHSHRTILCETHQLHWMSPAVGPPSITGTPFGHFMGMTSALLVPLLRDYPVNVVDVWDPAEVLRLMIEKQLSLGGGAPYFLMSVLDHPDCTPEHIALMPYCGLGGSTVPVAVTERATSLGISTYRSYGSTEHPSITVSYLDEPEVKRLTTDGHASPGVEFRLDDEGQILSRGPDCFLGYTDPALTAKAVDADGWYHTGDVGVVDSDGYLTITDRISDVIIRGGENISAQEVEELLLTLDDVAEVYVVAAPDERFGERAAAVVRARPGGAVPSLEQVREHLAAKGLAKQKWPESIYALDDFPRTASGKVQKFRLREMLRDGRLRARP